MRERREGEERRRRRKESVGEGEERKTVGERKGGTEG